MERLGARAFAGPAGSISTPCSATAATAATANAAASPRRTSAPPAVAETEDRDLLRPTPPRPQAQMQDPTSISSFSPSPSRRPTSPEASFAQGRSRPGRWRIRRRRVPAGIRLMADSDGPMAPMACPRNSAHLVLAPSEPAWYPHCRVLTCCPHWSPHLSRRRHPPRPSPAAGAGADDRDARGS